MTAGVAGDETDGSLVDLRCSVVVTRNDEFLLLHRESKGRDDWVLPGGRPREGESTLACARRERIRLDLGNVWRPDPGMRP